MIKKLLKFIYKHSIGEIVNFIRRFNNSDFCVVTPKDRRQILIIIVLTSLVAIGQSIYYSVKFNANKNYLRLSGTNSSKVDTFSYEHRNLIDKYDTLGIKEFDPNSVSYDLLLKYGLSRLSAYRVVSFRNRGGSFLIKSDFYLFAGISIYEQSFISKYIMLPEVFDKSLYPRHKTHIRYKYVYPKITSSSYKRDSMINFRFDSIKNKYLPIKIQYFAFDPNSVSDTAMYILGFKSYQIDYILEMRENQKKFYVKEDLSALNFITPEFYAVLEPYIKINFDSLSAGKHLIDINTADATELVKYGKMKKAIAYEVIEYRQKLGGYTNVWQMNDNRLFEYTRFMKIRPLFYVCARTPLRKIDINHISAEELREHPYFSRRQAQNVIKHIALHGQLTDRESFGKIVGFDNEEYMRIVPYLDFIVDNNPKTD